MPTTRTSRLLAGAAVCLALAATTLPALAGTPSADRPSGAQAQPSQTLSARPTPAPVDAQAPVSRTPRSATPVRSRTRTAHTSPVTLTSDGQNRSQSHGHSRPRTHSPARVLRHAEHGKAAVTALGTKLPAVAARAGWSPDKLRSVLSTDQSAYVSDTGRVYYREDDLAEQASVDPQTAQATAVAPIYPTSQTFALHSHPSSTRKIFLDFDGATVSGTGWNGSTAGKTPDGSHPGFDLDGNPATFSTAEQGYIQEVWREVAEDYSPFDVDVTTQDPGVAGITRSSTSDTTYGTHVVITNDPAPRTNLCSGSCLGVAYVGTFDNVDPSGYYQPAWVFDYDKTFDPMIIAQAAAHETGHTLGLSHDGVAAHGSAAAQPYSFGTAAWGPLMGGSMNRAVTQWSQGEYANANNKEDDLQVIANTGLPLRPDDHPGTTTLTPDPSYAVSGVISTRTDTDDFKITLPCTTTLTVNANGIGKQTALDLSLTVLDGNGQTVATSSPVSAFTGNPPVSNGMNAGVSVPNASGTYVLRVDGVGNGSALAGGWSDYGSLGQYTLTANGCPSTSTATPGLSVPSMAPVGTSLPLPADGDQPASAPPSPAPTYRAPRAPKIATASPGAKKGAKTATARWSAPSTTRETPVTSYRVQAVRLDQHGKVAATYNSRALGAGVRSISWQLPAGRYHFRVRAFNRAGGSSWSSYSRVVAAR